MLANLIRPVVGVGILILSVVIAESQASDKESVWFWFESCGASDMGLEITLDGVEVYKTSFSMCKRTRDSIRNNRQQRTLKFSFVPRREIIWKGYLDENNVTKSGQTIEGNVWQAGADPNAIILGVSFSTTEHLLMNTLHVMHPGIHDKAEIEPGLVITTYPAKNNNLER